MKKEKLPTSFILTVEFSDGLISTAECETNQQALDTVEVFRVNAGQDRINHGTTYTVAAYRITPVYAV